jgi:hypothetical protein
MWKRHALLVAGVLLALFALVCFPTRDRVGFALGLGFVFVPAAVTYTALSTALVFALRQRRRGVYWAHGIALAAGTGVVFFWIK